MDDIWARVTVVAGTLLMGMLITLVIRVRARRPEVEFEALPLGAGVYFFSSTTCPTCENARTKLNAHLGEEGYTEFVWDEQPRRFVELGVEVVPAVLVVTDSGRARLYPGQPERALARLGR